MKIFEHFLFAIVNIQQMKKNQLKCAIDAKLQRFVRNQTFKQSALKKLQQNDDKQLKDDQDDFDDFELSNSLLLSEFVIRVRLK